MLNYNMGCGTSSNSSRTGTPEYQKAANIEIMQLNAMYTDPKDIIKRPTETLVQGYQRLDEEISIIENLCPGPRLLTAEAWIEHLETMNANPTSEDIMDPLVLKNNPNHRSEVTIPGTADTPMTALSERHIPLPDPDPNSEQTDIAKVRRLTVKLGVVFDVNKATKQEEFLARVSRGSMEVEAMNFRLEMIEYAKNRASHLLDSYNKLRYLYIEQDNLLASVTGGTYSSRQEQQLDAQLEAVRETRDKLGGVAEQWRTSGALLRASAKGSMQSVEFWNLVGPSKNANERVTLALDCRSACHGSLAALEGAQAALPQVEIPYISLRQASAVKHAIIYILTDMANESRYRHTKEVLEVFSINTTKAVQWVHDTYNRTLKKDIDESNENVMEISKKLRQTRIKYINDKVGSQQYLAGEIDGK